MKPPSAPQRAPQRTVLAEIAKTATRVLRQCQELMRQLLRMWGEITAQLDRIEGLCKPRAKELVIPVGAPTDQPVEEKPPMAAAITMTGVQQFAIGPVTAVDRRGNPAPLDGPPTFTSDNDSIATISAHPSGDPNMALCKAAGPNGTAQITISADADLGAGVTALQDFIGVNIVPEQAVALTTPTGPVEDQ